MSARPRFSQKQRADARMIVKRDNLGRMYGMSGPKSWPMIDIATGAAGSETVPVMDVYTMLAFKYLTARRKALCVRYSDRVRRWHHRDGRRRGRGLQGR